MMRELHQADFQLYEAPVLSRIGRVEDVILGISANGTDVETTGNPKRSVGRPRCCFAPGQISELRGRGMSFREIARKMGLGYGTVRRAFLNICSTSPPTGRSDTTKS